MFLHLVWAVGSYISSPQAARTKVPTLLQYIQSEQNQQEFFTILLWHPVDYDLFLDQYIFDLGSRHGVVRVRQPDPRDRPQDHGRRQDLRRAPAQGEPGIMSSSTRVSKLLDMFIWLLF